MSDAVKEIVGKIEEDICNRRGLRQEFERIDDDIQQEIRKEWAKIVRSEIKKLQSDNEKLLACVEFYAEKAFNTLYSEDNSDMVNEKGYQVAMVIDVDREWCGKNSIGGKLARETLAEIRGKSEAYK